MTPPRISVVTVVLNDASGLSRTIASVTSQNYKNIQFIVIDGGSSDGCQELIERHHHVIDIWTSETDEGIYHAMNKGMALANGEWILYMNAGDTFSDADTLSSVAALITEKVDVIYSDWQYRETGVFAKADLTRMNVRHQSVLYRKNLHEIFGTYVVGKRVSISDFIFFLSISNRPWTYCNKPISICSQEGVSASPSHFYQRIATEFIFGRRNRFATSAIIILYPLYRFLKRQVLRKR